jgi:hypothetical protein
MPEPETLSQPPPGEDPLVSSLAALKPSRADLNRDGLMYAAGAESRRGVIRLWQAAAGFMAAVGFAAGMFARPGGVETKTVYVEVPVPAPATALPDATPEPIAPLAHRPPQPRPYARAWMQFQTDLLSLSLSVLPAPSPEKQ